MLKQTFPDSLCLDMSKDGKWLLRVVDSLDIYVYKLNNTNSQFSLFQHI